MLLLPPCFTDEEVQHREAQWLMDSHCYQVAKQWFTPNQSGSGTILQTIILCSLSLYLVFCSYLCTCLMILFCSIFVFLCLLAHGTLQTLEKWNSMGMTFFFKEILDNSKIWEPLGKAFNISGNDISGGDKGQSIHFFWQLAFSHNFDFPAYLSKQFSFCFTFS